MPDAFSGAAQDVGAAAVPGTQAAPIGVDHIMDDAGRTFYDTPFDDLIEGGAGNDTIFLSGRQDIVHAGDGNDTIVANGDGSALLDSGTGDDTILLTSTLPFNTLEGGEGNTSCKLTPPTAWSMAAWAMTAS